MCSGRDCLLNKTSSLGGAAIRGGGLGSAVASSYDYVSFKVYFFVVAFCIINLSPILWKLEFNL